MKQITTITIFLFMVFLCSANIAYADGCRPEEISEAESEQKANYNKGIELEKSGRLEDAYNAYGGESECGNEDLNKRTLAAMKRLAKRIAELKEGRKDFEGAIEWYAKAGNYDKADKLMMEWVNTKPDDKKLFSKGFDYFQLLSEPRKSSEQRAQKALAYLKELDRIASANGDKYLAKENKIFESKTGGHLSESPEAIKSAKEWFRFFDTRTADALNRAEKRGDFFFKGKGEEEAGVLNIAKEYYQIAENEGKINSVKVRANELGDAYAKKGEPERAVKYYEVAENETKAGKLSEVAEKKNKGTEKQRKKQFKKEQDDLEKELGL